MLHENQSQHSFCKMKKQTQNQKKNSKEIAVIFSAQYKTHEYNINSAHIHFQHFLGAKR